MDDTTNAKQATPVPHPARRQLLKTAGAAAAGTAAIFGAPFIRNAAAAEPTTWKVQKSWHAGVGLQAFKTWAMMYPGDCGVVTHTYTKCASNPSAAMRSNQV